MQCGERLIQKCHTVMGDHFKEELSSGLLPLRYDTITMGYNERWKIVVNWIPIKYGGFPKKADTFKASGW